MRSTVAGVDGLVESVVNSRLPSPGTRRSIREDAGVSLREAAQALGVTALTVQRWERGDARPRRQHAVEYRQFLDALRETLDAVG